MPESTDVNRVCQDKWDRLEGTPEVQVSTTINILIDLAENQRPKRISVTASLASQLCQDCRYRAPIESELKT